MSYVEQNLMPGEQVIRKAKLHWAIFLAPGIISGVSFMLMVVAMLVGGNGAGGGVALFGLFFFLGLVGVGQAAATFLSTEFAITDRRVIAKRGVIRRHSLELLLGKVESIGVNQPILGRMLNYGTITVVGTGGTKEAFPCILEPMEFRKIINAQVSPQLGVI